MKPQPYGTPASLSDWSLRIANACHDHNPDQSHLIEHSHRLEGKLFPFEDERGTLVGYRCPYGQPGDRTGTFFREASPPSDGWYFIKWEPTDEWRLVWLVRVEDEPQDDIPDDDVERWVWGESPNDDPERICLDVADPLGIEWKTPGDRLWVRETWGVDCRCDRTAVRGQPYDHKILYREMDERPTTPQWEPFKWKPSIHMFRKDSRIDLLIKDIRVERLQDITPEDIWAEGLWNASKEYREQSCTWRDCAEALNRIKYKYFSELWDSINGKTYPWDSNPWVWVVEFEKLPDAHSHDIS